MLALNADAEAVEILGQPMTTGIPGGNIEVRGPEGEASVRVAFVGHALPRSYHQQHYLVVQQAPPDFRAATGLQYFAGERDNYDPGRHCISDQGASHIDFRDCPDKSFHERRAVNCVPLAEYFAHYSQH